MIFSLSKNVISGAIFAAALPALLAQDVRLDTVQISSTRIAQRAIATGRNVSIITAEQIAKMPTTTLDEVLRYVPGMEVQSRGGFGAQSDITMRGSTFQQVLILVDGVRLNDALTGHFNGYLPIPPSEIARIEVLRGPAAAIYGPDAVGGVVNLITKTFDTQSKTENGATATIGVGEYKLQQTQFGGNWQGKKAMFSAGFIQNSTSGQLLPSGTRNDVRATTQSAAAAYKIGSWRAAIRGSYDVRDFNAQYFYTNSPYDFARENTSMLWTQANISHIGTKSRTVIDAAYKYGTDNYVFGPVSPKPSQHTTRFAFVRAEHAQTLNQQLTVVGGVQADTRSVVSNALGEHETLHVGAYAQGVAKPWDGATVNASLRGDLDQNYGAQLLPQLNVSQTVANVVFRAAAGRNIRAADFTERFTLNIAPKPISPGRSVGNPDLKAETGWSYEMGGDIFPVKGLRLSATGFYRQGRNLIDYGKVLGKDIKNLSNVDTNSSYNYAQNLAMLNTIGAEFELWLKKDFNELSSVTATLGYMFVETKDTADKFPTSVYFSTAAHQLYTTNITLQLGNFSLGINGLYKVRNAQADIPVIKATFPSNYGVWNMRMSYGFFDNRFAPYLQINNIFNKIYSDRFGCTMPLRWGFGGISIKL